MDGLFSNIIRGVGKVTMPLWTKMLSKSRRKPLGGKQNGLVLSLTTIPSRIDGLWIVLESIFRQDVMPDRVVLTLSELEFPGGVDSLPESVRDFIRHGLEIVFLPDDVKCHKKYFHTLKSCADSCVITIDDDCWYPRDTIGRLVKIHSMYPDCVVANFVRIIDRENFYDYQSWKRAKTLVSSRADALAIGAGGVMYPAHFAQSCQVHGCDIFDMELFGRLAPFADDLWLKANEVSSGIKVAGGGPFTKPLTIPGSQKVALRKLNKGAENRNDAQWRALDEHFQLRNRI